MKEAAICDAAEFLETDEDVAAYLDAALDEGDPALVSAALGDIARARGMADIREKVSRFLDEDGRVARAWLFGSRARGDARPDSDIDLLVEFDEPASIGTPDLVSFSEELSSRFDVEVDVLTWSKYRRFHPEVLESIERDKVMVYDRRDVRGEPGAGPAVPMRKRLHN